MSESDPLEDDFTQPVVMAAEDALILLTLGHISVEGTVTTASNATLYCRVEHEGTAAAAVYKPVAGERPLWDYPTGTLAEREYAAYLVGAACGWDVVPPTVLRDGPMGTGMLQLWVEPDEDVDIFAAVNGGRLPALQRVALFDAVINNSDRKVSHLLAVRGGEHVFGIDHGVSCGVEDKLRTVLWQWADDPIPDDGLAMLGLLEVELAGALGERLEELLTRTEVRALTRRVRRLAGRGRFPLPPTAWPAIPYPPY